jgi:Glucose-repressible protein Grg1
MEFLKQGANYVSETVQQATTSGTSKEANKKVAKDSSASIGTRYSLYSRFHCAWYFCPLMLYRSASNAKEAVGDKASESKHDAKAEAHKQQM